MLYIVVLLGTENVAIYPTLFKSTTEIVLPFRNNNDDLYFPDMIQFQSYQGKVKHQIVKVIEHPQTLLIRFKNYAIIHRICGSLLRQSYFSGVFKESMWMIPYLHSESSIHYPTCNILLRPVYTVVILNQPPELIAGISCFIFARFVHSTRRSPSCKLNLW